MGYEEQLRQAEQILDKLTAARQPDTTIQEWVKQLESDMRVLGALGVIQLVVLVLLVIAHLGH